MHEGAIAERAAVASMDCRPPKPRTPTPLLPHLLGHTYTYSFSITITITIRITIPIRQTSRHRPSFQFQSSSFQPDEFVMADIDAAVVEAVGAGGVEG